MYGVGFGAVSPTIPAGQVAVGLNSLTTPLSVFFGPAQASVPYYGLAPGYIGLYQFNVVVPTIAGNNAGAGDIRAGQFEQPADALYRGAVAAIASLRSAGERRRAKTPARISNRGVRTFACSAFTLLVNASFRCLDK